MNHSTIIWLLSLSLLSSASAAQTLNVDILAIDDQPASDIVVYITPLDNQSLARTDKTLTISQQNRAFIPFASVMQSNENISFYNQDEFTHHIYATGKNKFSLRINAGENKVSHGFSSPGEVAMGCNIHDWMSGYLLLVDTPYFAKTDDQGHASFNIKQSGRFQINIWHPLMDESSEKMTQEIDMSSKHSIKLTLKQSLAKAPEQSSDEDFDFLSGY